MEDPTERGERIERLSAEVLPETSRPAYLRAHRSLCGGPGRPDEHGGCEQHAAEERDHLRWAGRQKRTSLVGTASYHHTLYRVMSMSEKVSPTECLPCAAHHANQGACRRLLRTGSRRSSVHAVSTRWSKCGCSRAYYAWRATTSFLVGSRSRACASGYASRTDGPACCQPTPQMLTGGWWRSWASPKRTLSRAVKTRAVATVTNAAGAAQRSCFTHGVLGSWCTASRRRTVDSGFRGFGIQRASQRPLQLMQT